MTENKRDLMVGGVFISGVIMIGIFTIVIKDITWFQGKQEHLVVLFDRVSGLEVGHKVLASGMEVGQVRELHLQNDGKVKVHINLVRPLQLFDGYQIAVKDASALGGKYVDIQLGNSAEGEIPLRQIHEGVAQPSLFDDPNLRDTFVSLKKITRTLQENLEEKDKQGTIALLLTRRDLYDNLLETSRNLKEISDQIQNPEGTVGKLLYERKFAEDLSKTVENIHNLTEDLRVITDDVKEITHGLRAGEGTAGKLLKDESLYRETEKVMRNLAKITDKIRRGEGTIGKLMVKDEVYQQLELALGDARTMMQRISQAMDDVNRGKGTLSTLLHDEEMATDLKDTLANLRVVSERLKKGEGTVGKLLADESLYKELQRVVKSFSDSLEDTREQVPISTFTNILFKAF